MMNVIEKEEQKKREGWRTDVDYGPASPMQGLGLTKWHDRSRLTVNTGRYTGYDSPNPTVDITPEQAKTLLADAGAFDMWMQSTLPGIPARNLAEETLRKGMEWLVSA